MPASKRTAAELWNTGVYLIRNKINGKVYVGSASGEGGFDARWRGHKSGLRKGNHDNPHLQSAWNKYGEEAFEFVVLVRCLPEHCVDNEQKHIDRLLASERQYGYNMCPVARSMLGFKFSDESRAKLSVVRIGNQNHPKGTPSGFRGQKHTEEDCAKMSRSRKGRVISDEWRAKLSESLKGRKKSEETVARMRLAASKRRKDPRGPRG